MAVKRVADLVKDAINEVIQKLNYELVDVEYQKKFDGMNLTVFIYKPEDKGGITLDDCEAVSKAIDPILDELDPTSGEPYKLNVSSPGLDRPIKTDRDYERAIGNEIDVKLFAPLNSKKIYTGILTETNTDYIILECEDGKVQIEKDKIATVIPVIKF